MKLKNLSYSFILILILSSCTQLPSAINSAVIDTSKCDVFEKYSDVYVHCVNELVKTTNTAKNLNEFRKHKTLKSFFKQVYVISSD